MFRYFVYKQLAFRTQGEYVARTRSEHEKQEAAKKTSSPSDETWNPEDYLYSTEAVFMIASALPKSNPVARDVSRILATAFVAALRGKLVVAGSSDNNAHVDSLEKLLGGFGEASKMIRSISETINRPKEPLQNEVEVMKWKGNKQ